MASDEQQFYQLLDCLMSLDNNTRQQAEVKYKVLFQLVQPTEKKKPMSNGFYIIP